jgi:arylsulfatase A-like enzyme
MLTHLDKHVGEILTKLQTLGLLENTIIFFAGDNGYSEYGYFGRKPWTDDPVFHNKGPWRAGKFICQEGGLRVPFFAYWQNKIKSRDSDHICALYDFLETAADLAGTLSDSSTDGISLVPELESRPDKQPQHEYLYFESGSMNPHGQAVRMGPWKAYREHPEKPTELYSIETDVKCEINVADRYPDIVDKIEQIFTTARKDSKWYINPGENAEEIQAKKHRAEQQGSMQVPTRANSKF